VHAPELQSREPSRTSEDYSRPIVNRSHDGHAALSAHFYAAQRFKMLIQHAGRYALDD
jgi:hypothetical protein